MGVRLCGSKRCRSPPMLQFSTPNSGALSSWGPCTGDAGETQGPSDPSQYRQEADSASLERLPSRPARRLVGQDGVGLGSAEWRDREGQVPGAYEQVAARHSPARWDLPHPPGPGLSGKAGSPRGLSACSGLIISEKLPNCLPKCPTSKESVSDAPHPGQHLVVSVFWILAILQVCSGVPVLF